MELSTIRKRIEKEGADLWLILDYENKNPAMVSLLGKRMLTRKIFAFLFAAKKPVLLCHIIDLVKLDDEGIKKDFDLVVYKTWQEMLEKEKELLEDVDTVMMDVSEYGLLPRVSFADFGSVDFVRSLGKTIKPSADLLQFFSAVLSEKSLQSQILACKTALKIKDKAFLKIKEDIEEKGYSDELDIQQYICREFDIEGMVYDEAPIVAIGPNASDPHYAPDAEHHARIKEGDLVLIDMWAKYAGPDDVYADITWMGYVGSEIPEVYKTRFEIVKRARDGVIEFLQRELPLRAVSAYEADDVARRIISEAGYGDYFIHRVGHNIGVDVSPHGPGANLDNFETHDFRCIMDGTSFSDEPGIYAPDFGVRSETDLHFRDGKLLVVGGLQDAIIPILDQEDSF